MQLLPSKVQYEGGAVANHAGDKSFVNILGDTAPGSELDVTVEVPVARVIDEALRAEFCVPTLFMVFVEVAPEHRDEEGQIDHVMLRCQHVWHEHLLH